MSLINMAAVTKKDAKKAMLKSMVGKKGEAKEPVEHTKSAIKGLREFVSEEAKER